MDLWVFGIPLRTGETIHKGKQGIWGAAPVPDVNASAIDQPSIIRGPAKCNPYQKT